MSILEVHNKEFVETPLMRPFLSFISCKFVETVLHKRRLCHKDHCQDGQWIYFKESRLQGHKGSAVCIIPCILHPLDFILSPTY